MPEDATHDQRLSDTIGNINAFPYLKVKDLAVRTFPEGEIEIKLGHDPKLLEMLKLISGAQWLSMSFYRTGFGNYKIVLRSKVDWDQGCELKQVEGGAYCVKHHCGEVNRCGTLDCMHCKGVGNNQ